LYGSGQSVNWPSSKSPSLSDEADFIEPVFAAAGTPLSLVGHSYGAAVALVAANANPARISSIAVYEPTLFSLIDAHSPPPNQADGIRRIVENCVKSLDAGRPDEAAGHFIDYWMGPGSWSRTPDSRKIPIAASIVHVQSWARALVTEPTALDAFRQLDVPVLYMLGKRTTESALAVAQCLTAVLPRVEVLTFEDLGHMGPVTNPDQVNTVVADFLRRTVRT
jgi:pimeloyl-ACP methyl ester carboxylesterase